MAESRTGQRTEPWLDNLATKEGIEENKSRFWAKGPSRLVTEATIDSGTFVIGNGANVYESTILPALESAQREIILVTCFWAHSVSLERLSATLVKLSIRHCFHENEPKLRIRLCFSSRSLTQKLFHTSSPAGYIYPPSRWQSLGLPSPDLLENLDLQVKSLFFLPFSVTHPKFVIIDRQRALLPSCNLSWQSWLECCLPITGPFVDTLVEFWQHTWGRNDLPSLDSEDSQGSCPTTLVSAPNSPKGYDGTVSTKPTNGSATSSPVLVGRPSSPVKTVLLPSPHHRAPRFRPIIAFAPPPPTPLNVYLIYHISNAVNHIQLLTPNLTSPPVISALLSALKRGVNVTLITNRRMMVLEQLLTAGTITEICVWNLRRRWKKLLNSKGPSTFSASMEEGRYPNPGALQVGYFIPNGRYAKSHIKCTIVDEKVVVLGSGNMDRASWYTSQELGIALEGGDVVRDVWKRVERELNEGKMGGVEWLRSQGYGATRTSHSGGV